MALDRTGGSADGQVAPGRGKVRAGFRLMVALDLGYRHATRRQLALRPFPHRCLTAAPASL